LPSALPSFSLFSASCPPYALVTIKHELEPHRVMVGSFK
jgi:hypothetical protein